MQCARYRRLRFAELCGRGRNQLLHASGTIPRLANTKPMRAAEDAMRMSIGSVMVAPKPTAAPLMAAMTGFVSA